MRILIPLLALGFLPATLTAQQPVTRADSIRSALLSHRVQPARTFLRVRTTGGQLAGRYADLSNDTLVVKDRQREGRVAATSVVAIDSRRYRRLSMMGRGALIAGIGGAVLGYATTPSCRPSDFICFGPEFGAMVLGTLGVVGGSVVGLIVGWTNPEWRMVYSTANTR